MTKIAMKEQFLKVIKIYLIYKKKVLQKLKIVINNISYELEQNKIIEQKRQEYRKKDHLEISKEKQFIFHVLISITNDSSS